VEPPKIEPVEPPPAKIELPPAQDLLFRPIPAAPLPELPPVSIVEAPKPAAPEPREVDEYPLVFTRASAFGETPMLRNWKMLAVYSLTVVVVSQPAPVVAQDKAVGERLDKLEASLKKSFEDLGLDIKSLTGDVGSVKNQLTKLQADITSLQTESLGNKLKIDTLTGKLESLEGQVSKLHKEVDGLRKRLDLDLTHVGSSPIDKLAIEELRLKLAGIEKAILGLTPPASRTVLSGSSRGSCGRKPIFMFGIGSTSPSTSLSSSAMIRRSVDLPDPFRPSTPIFAPGKKLSEMFLRISRLGGTTLPTRRSV